MDYETFDARLKRIEKDLNEYKDKGKSIDNKAKILYENLLRMRSDTLHLEDIDMFEIGLRADAVIKQNTNLFF